MMNCIIFDTEIEFFDYIINNKENVVELYVFSDYLDNIIYFYCFYDNKELLIASKEKDDNSFEYYLLKYRKLAFDLNLFILNDDKSKVLRLKK